jgi:hypothetical protein
LRKVGEEGGALSLSGWIEYNLRLQAFLYKLRMVPLVYFFGEIKEDMV